MTQQELERRAAAGDDQAQDALYEQELAEELADMILLAAIVRYGFTRFAFEQALAIVARTNAFAAADEESP